MVFSIVMAHKEVLPVVERHLEFWQKVSDKLIFTSPKDSMMGIDNEIGIGRAEHHGELSAQRITNIFGYALKQSWDYFILFEYDAIALDLPDDVFPESGVSAAGDEQNKPNKYSASFYLHYPMIFDRTGAEKIFEYLPKVKTNDRYMSDRFIGMAAELSGINVKNLRETDRAYTRNTILQKHRPQVARAARKGVVFYHGIKIKYILKTILGNYNG